jgi:hypothetical protein
MSKRAPNKFIAPVVIAGFTIGFLASAYTFIFKSSERRLQKTSQPITPNQEQGESPTSKS